MAIVRAEEPNCHLCGNPIDTTLDRQRHPLGSTGDELRPREFGGDPEDRANVRHAHRVCNSLRHLGLITDELRAACRAAYEEALHAMGIATAPPAPTPTTDDTLSRRW